MDDQFNLDLNDILNEKLMPASLFLNEDNENDFIKGTNITRKYFYQNLSHKKFNMNDAIHTMRYHREKMNEYLLTNFVAKQIVSELAWTPKRMQRRLGTVDSDIIEDVIVLDTLNLFTDIDVEPRKKLNQNPNHELLYDQGSHGYKQWLEKTTTLEDIYRQFGQNQFSPQPNRTENKTNGNLKNIKRSEEVEYEDDDYEEGEITGYAYPKPNPVQMPYQTLPDNIVQSFAEYGPAVKNFMSYPMPTAGSKNGYPHPSPQETFDHHEEYGAHYPVQQSPISGLKEIGLKDILDIALTTLAFLSFGMFILQVLMCITMSNGSENNSMMMMPMENMETETESIEEIRRKRRSIENDRIIKVNELSRRVLLSIDTVLYASKDDGKCLQKVLCENNNFARQQKDGQKIWLPVWSLGISWLSSRFATYSSVLNGLKATAIGLGGGNCMKTFGDCEFY